MPTPTGPKRKRKNMNLSEGLFLMLERLKRQDEKKIGVPLAWDNFFKRSFDELVRWRSRGAEGGRA